MKIPASIRKAILVGVALFSVACALAQTPSAQPAATTASPAYIYVQNAQGIDVYTVTSAGKPTLLKGSPFPVSGLFQGVNGAYLITVGTYWLHSYKIATTGAVGKEVARIDTRVYDGSQCGPSSGGGKFDHTGKYFYALLAAYDGTPISEGGCAALQSYQLQSNGQFRFIGTTSDYGNIQGYVAPGTLPVIASNNKSAYGMLPQFEDGRYTSFSKFSILPNGVMTGSNGGEEDGYYPGPWPDTGCSYFYYPSSVVADNAGHIAAVVNLFACDGPAQLATYTVQSNGDLQTASTESNMLSPKSGGGSLAVSPSGKILTVFGGQGLELFHFNGAAPFTRYKTLLPGISFAAPAWDTNNHMYAFGNGLLYAFTITPTSIAVVPGSPFRLKDTSGTMFITAHAW